MSVTQKHGGRLFHVNGPASANAQQLAVEQLVKGNVEHIGSADM